MRNRKWVSISGRSAFTINTLKAGNFRFSKYLPDLWSRAESLNIVLFNKNIFFHVLILKKVIQTKYSASVF